MPGIDVQEKVCSLCGEAKPVTEFYPRYDRTSGRVSQCKTCDKKRAAEAQRARNQDPNYRPRYLQRMRVMNRRRRYDLSEEDALRLLSVERCEACGRTAEEAGGQGPTNRSLHIDHDHDTGQVRGVLCWACNNILGRADDDPARLRVLADYLEKR